MENIFCVISCVFYKQILMLTTIVIYYIQYSYPSKLHTVYIYFCC